MALLTFKDAWASSDGYCHADFRGASFTATDAETDVIAAYRESLPGLAGVVDDEGTYEAVLDACVQRDQWVAGSFAANEVEARLAVTSVCPDAPHADLLAKIASGEAFRAGTWEVGTEIPPGTYRSSGDTEDCYWARLTRNGDIIDNDFVSTAVDGIVVTVRSGEVFESERGCEYWVRE